MLNTIQHLAVSEDVRLLVDTGLVRQDLIKRLEIYAAFLNYVEETGSVMQAMDNTAIDFKVDTGVIRYVRNCIESSPLSKHSLSPVAIVG